MLKNVLPSNSNRCRCLADRAIQCAFWLNVKNMTHKAHTFLNSKCSQIIISTLSTLTPLLDITHCNSPDSQNQVSNVVNVHIVYSCFTIDTKICAFWGSIFFGVRVKQKPHKYGIKIFQLCEPNVAMYRTLRYVLAKTYWHGSQHWIQCGQKAVTASQGKEDTMYTNWWFYSQIISIIFWHIRQWLQA
jgi:hypothetical protein